MFSALIERWKGAAYALAGVLACEVVAPVASQRELPEISGGYYAMYAQLRAARQKQAI